MTPASTTTLTILGLGNTMAGDDGAGVAVLEELRKRALPAHVQLQFVPAPGPELVDLLREEGQVWFIDAVRDADQPAGSIVHCQLDATDAATLKPAQHLVSTHGFSLAELLRLGEVLGAKGARIELWGIVGERFEAGRELSSEVANAIPILATRIERAIGGDQVS